MTQPIPDDYPATAGTHWQALRQDVQRYGGWLELLREQSLWAVLWFRIGGVLTCLPRVLGKPLLTIWWLLFRFTEMATGVSLPVGIKAKGGLRIWHFGGIFINAQTHIGRNCTLRQGVTIGNRHNDGASPVIGDDVELGAYAQVLGDIRVGHRARIGALSVVLRDVPDDASAVGSPARILTRPLSPTAET